MRVVDWRPRNYALEAAGAKPKRRGQFLAKPALDYFVLESLCIQGKTQREISARLGRSQSSVNRCLKRYGLFTRETALKAKKLGAQSHAQS